MGDCSLTSNITLFLLEIILFVAFFLVSRFLGESFTVVKGPDFLNVGLQESSVLIVEALHSLIKSLKSVHVGSSIALNFLLNFLFRPTN